MNLIKFINNLLPKKYQNNRGLVGAVVSAATSIGSKAAENGGSGSSGFGQIIGNIGNRDIKNKGVRAGMNVVDFGGGLSNTLAAFGIDIFGKKKEIDIPAPEYYTDPVYAETMNYLKNFGQETMKGNISPYLKEVGELGGPEFERMLGVSNREVTQATAEQAAKVNRSRGGYLPSQTAKNVMESSGTSRYKDYERAMKGREYMFGQGIGAVKAVRDATQEENIFKNSANWKGYETAIEWRDYGNKKKAQDDEDTGSIIGSLLSIATSSKDEKSSGSAT